MCKTFTKYRVQELLALNPDLGGDSEGGSMRAGHNNDNKEQATSKQATSSNKNTNNMQNQYFEFWSARGTHTFFTILENSSKDPGRFFE